MTSPTAPTPLTAPALAVLSKSFPTSPIPPSLSGDTPCPSDIDGDTLASRPTSIAPKEKASDLESLNELTKSTAADVVVEHYPEGGLHAWLTLGGAMLVLFSCFGFSNSFGAFVAEYQKHQLKSYPSSTITWIGSVHLCLVFGMGLLSGAGFDRGYFRWQLIIGSCMWVFGLFMLSLSKTYGQIFLSQSVCLGLGLGTMFGPVLSSVGTYFRRRRGICIGCAASGAALGAIMYPILLNNLFASIGFGPAVRVAGYISAALLLVANLLIRPRVLPRRKEHRPALPLILSFARQPSMWLCCFGVFGGVLGVFIIMFFVQVYTKAHTPNAVLANYSLAILNACACLGRVSIGFIVDRVGAFNTIIPCAFIMGGATFALLGATTTAGAVIFLFLFGVTSGGFISVFASCFMGLANDVSEIGVRSGMGFLFVAVAALIGSPIAGAILAAANGQYWAPCVFGGGSTLVGAGLLWAARQTQVNRRQSWRV